MVMDIEKIIAASRKVSTTDVFSVSDISIEIIKVAKQVYLDYSEMDPWFMGTHMIEVLKHLGKANVRNHLEKLVDKQQLQSGLFGTKKVYKLRVLNES